MTRGVVSAYQRVGTSNLGRKASNGIDTECANNVLVAPDKVTCSGVAPSVVIFMSSGKGPRTNGVPSDR